MASGQGRLTTHVLDTANGRPAEGVAIELFRIDGAERRLLRRADTNADGRCDQPLLAGGNLTPGIYELVFHVGEYFARRGSQPTGTPFLDVVPVRFGVGDAGQHYHVPLLIAPFSYATYRGS